MAQATDPVCGMTVVDAPLSCNDGSAFKGAAPDFHPVARCSHPGAFIDYRTRKTIAVTSTSAASTAVMSPPSLVLRGAARRCRIPCRPRT